jgi:hypothetical protein
MGHPDHHGPSPGRYHVEPCASGYAAQTLTAGFTRTGVHSLPVHCGGTAPNVLGLNKPVTLTYGNGHYGPLETGASLRSTSDLVSLTLDKLMRKGKNDHPQ